MNEDDGTLAPGKLYADYPLWTLVDETLHNTLGMPGGVPKINFPTKGPVLAIFTDLDLAERFLRETQHGSVKPLALLIPEAVLKIAEYFEKAGVKLVAIDIGVNPPSAHLYPIEEFLDDVRRGAT